MTPPIIQPTVGRIVWFYGVPYDEDTRKFGTRISDQQPMAAQICYVHTTDAVNLRVTDHAGRDFAVRMCPLYQGTDEAALWNINHCRWMPYQRLMAEVAGKSGSVQLT